TALVSGLTQHAGQFDFALDQGVAQSDLTSNPQSDAFLANLRHRFASGLEVYGDVVVLRSHGQSQDRSATGEAIVSPSSPVNPFTDYIEVDFPILGADQTGSTHAETTRYTIGLTGELPFDWRGSAEMSTGSFRFGGDSATDFPLSSALLLLLGDASDL